MMHPEDKEHEYPEQITISMIVTALITYGSIAGLIIYVALN